MVARTLPGLGLTGFWPLGQNGWKDANDVNLRLLSVVSRGFAKSRTVALPGAPALGDIYIVPSGDATNPNKLAVWDGEAGFEDWVYIDPLEGMWFFVDDDAERVQYVDGAWAVFSGGGGGGGGGGDPVTTDFIGFRGDRSGGATQALTANVVATMTFDTEVFDTEGAFNPATGEFTVPASLNGKYMAFFSGVRLTTSPTSWAGYIQKNGVGLVVFTAKSTDTLAIGTGPVLVSTGEVYTAAVWPGSSAGTLSGAVTNFFAGCVVLSDVAGGGGDEGASSAVEEVAGTTYTQVAADAGKWKRTTNAAAVTITIDANVNAANETITFEQGGAGLVTFAAGAGMTLTSRGAALASAGQHAVMGVKFRSPTEATLYGDIA